MEQAQLKTQLKDGGQERHLLLQKGPCNPDASNGKPAAPLGNAKDKVKH